MESVQEQEQIRAAEQQALARLLADDGPRGRLEAYGEHPDQIIEWYGSDGPIVVVVHGGYFRPTIDRGHARPQARALVQAGWQVALVEYRRVSGDPDVTVADLTAAAEHLGGREALWMGHSAGGTLVLLRAAQGSRPVLALAPVARLADASEQRLGDSAVTTWVGGTPREHAAAYARLDPSALGLDGRAILCLHGEHDVTVPLTQSLRSGLPHEVCRGAHHFDLIDPQSPHWPTVLAAMTRLSGQDGRGREHP